MEKTRERYNNEVCYILSDQEKAILITALGRELQKINTKIDKVRNHPKNEGQATFAQKISCLQADAEELSNAISLLQWN